MRYLFLLMFITLQQVTTAAGIEFFQGTWEQALEKASKEEKINFCGCLCRMVRTLQTHGSQCIHTTRGR